MARLLQILTLVSLLLTGCDALTKAGSRTKTPCAVRPSHEKDREAYTLRQLVYSLDDRFWEVASHRGEWIDENYPNGVPEDFLSLPESGAQEAIAAIRLGSDLIAVVTDTDLMEGESDVVILRRTSEGWIDLTSSAFPYHLPAGSRITASADKSLRVRLPHKQGFQKYVWRDTSFVRKYFEQ